MVRPQTTYVPCLRWKQGEYQAVFRLAPALCSSLLPLIEVPEIGYDFERQALAHTIDEHLAPVATRVERKWGKARCLVDTSLVHDGALRMQDGSHPAEFVFSELRRSGVAAVPVIRLSHDNDATAALTTAALAAGIGTCLRANLVEATSGSFPRAVDDFLAANETNPGAVDFVLDLDAPNFEPLSGFAALVENTILRVPYLADWRTLTLLGTSFPSTMGEVDRGLNRRERKEWSLYQLVHDRLSSRGVRHVFFGDYAAAHPAVLRIDFRKVGPAASVRYASDAEWLIAKGRHVRQVPRDQYRTLCQSIVDAPEFDGIDFSAADAYIAGCAAGTESTGSPTTWRWVGTNRHLTKVQRILSSQNVT